VLALLERLHNWPPAEIKPMQKDGVVCGQPPAVIERTLHVRRLVSRQSPTRNQFQTHKLIRASLWLWTAFLRH